MRMLERLDPSRRRSGGGVGVARIPLRIRLG
jgi:hypothetical protein